MSTGTERTARAIVSRFMAGETLRELANDFDTTLDSIQECVRWAIRRYRGEAPNLDHSHKLWRRKP